ncbi:hypothetical protein BDM02DRAFT_3115148 [Thelephora ganbajun]|uniref:Uncharacterized protein n=1 Tax=Thelephora ganbajun TaxID=370292 RepID=A0ACB6ZG54_THEGA|nr:hypothetical protein BDM02DRAFT_3115148 [Thelephora ganbajun]
MYRGFYIPPVVFSVHWDTTSQAKVRLCVDGKQRLTAISGFVSGRIPYIDRENRRSFWFKQPKKKNGVEVPQSFKEEFLKMKIRCAEYDGINEIDEREVFQRVQLGTPLTSSEKLQAVSSPWTRWINTINAKFITGPDGLQDKLGISGKHASGYHAVAHIAYCCSHLPKKQKIPTFATLNKFLDQDTTPSKTLQRDMEDVMKKFTEIATIEKLRFGFSNIQQKVAPVEFVYIVNMLFMLIQVCDDITEMAQHIHDMRAYIRKEESDIRSNNKICTKLWKFVDSVMDEYDDSFQAPAKGKAAKSRKSARDDDCMPRKPQKRVKISEK